MSSVPTLDDDDEILLRIDSELEEAAGQPVGTSLGDIDKIFSDSKNRYREGKGILFFSISRQTIPMK